MKLIYKISLVIAAMLLLIDIIQVFWFERVLNQIDKILDFILILFMVGIPLFIVFISDNKSTNNPNS